MIDSNKSFDLSYLPYQNRWVACFDLLGVRQKMVSEVIPLMAMVIDSIRISARHNPIKYIWLSDTFLLYTDHASEAQSGKKFGGIEQPIRQLLDVLLTREVVFRGALAFGDFYADEVNHVYAGPALVKAYECAEAQDWIGFVISETALAKLKTMGGVPELLRQHYRTYEIPIKPRRREELSNSASGTSPSTRLPALILGADFSVKGGQMCVSTLASVSILKKLKEIQRDKGVKEKYSKTIKFLESVHFDGCKVESTGLSRM